MGVLLPTAGEVATTTEGGPFVYGERYSAVLLDRQALWLEAVERVLGRIDVSVKGKTTTSADALAAIEAHRPDVFVTGIDLGEGERNGITCIREARERQPQLKAVVLSSHSETEWIDRALDAGAVAYVVKSAHPDDLASAVRQAFDHSVYFAGSRPAAAAWPAQRSSYDDCDLTRREKEILRLVAEGHSNAKLAKMLWVTEQTVKFHLSNVYRKLNVSNRTEAARWAQVNGLLTEQPATPNDLAALATAG
jgi:two-component system response regulator DevR